jgi:CubicO group peptidase (beta-lactamase class C family)
MLSRVLPLLGVLAGVTGFAGAVVTATPLASSAARADHGEPRLPPVLAAYDTMSRIENGLTSANLSITSRMSTHKITGLSLVIVENNAIKWKRGYGLRIAGSPTTKVSSSTTFDAASVSKPLAAAAALRLVDQGRVSLTDTKVLGAVATRYVAAARIAPFLSQFENAGDIDLTRLLSHCAGVLSQSQVGNLTATGAQSFSLGSTLPSMGQQLVGLSPASSNFKPVQTSALSPGAMFQYSGASYLLVEAIIDRYAPNGFSAYTTDLFRDLGMSSSTFADYPLISTVDAIRKSNRFARGHSGGATRSQRNYANHAAASLVTTTEDLARFLIMVNQNGIYNGTRVLSAASVRALTGQSTNSRCANRSIGRRTVMGLGMRSHDTGTRFHRGTHNGYRAYIFARPANGWAMAVVMTGAGADADRFAPELFRSVETVYGFTTGTLVH